MSPSPRADVFYHAVQADLYQAASVWERRLAHTTRAARLAAVLGLIGFVLPWVAFARADCGPTITTYRLAAHLADTWQPAGWGLIIACLLYGLVAHLHRRAGRLFADTHQVVETLYADLRAWETNTPRPTPSRSLARRSGPRPKLHHWLEASRCLLLLIAVGALTVLAEPDAYRPPRNNLPPALSGRPFLHASRYPALAVGASGVLRVYAPGGRFSDSDPEEITKAARARADVPWLVYADEATPYAAVEDGLDLLRRAGVTRLRLMCGKPRGD